MTKPTMKRKLRRWKMWAITWHNEIEIWDGRAAIYCSKSIATQDMKKVVLPESSKVVAIEVRKLTRKKKP